MASFDELAVITDPDQLGFTVDVSFASSTEEIVIDTAAKTIALKVTGNLTKDGATIKSVYSKLKDAWRTNSTLVKFPFPMGPITDEQYEMVSGWNWDKVETSGAATQYTTELLRTGGWSVVNTSGLVIELWASAITLGDLGTLDQVYYQQVNEATASVNFKLTGKVNQAIQILRDDDGDGNYAEGSDYDRRTYYKMFVREWQKIYAQSEIADIGVSSMTYQAYRFPLTNSADLKVTHLEPAVGGTATSSGSWAGGVATLNTTELHGLTTGDSVVVAGVTPAGYNGTFTATVSDTDTITYTVADPGGVVTVQGTVRKAVYNNITITYLRHTDDTRYLVRGDWVTATPYALADVVKGTNDRWYKCILAHTSGAGSAPITGGSYATNWAAYEGERLIGSTYYPYDVIVDADTTVAATASGASRTAEIYEAVQYSLRQSSDIDADASATVTGKTANSLLRFVGDTLVTSTGVYIDSFNTQDTNAITFTDSLGDDQTFPFVAALTVNFGENLQNDQYSKYWIFFENAGGNLFGTTNAVVVDDKDGVDMEDDVNPAWPTKRSNVSHSFNYDSNVQGGRTAGTDANIIAVGIGLSTGQYVRSSGTIARSTANSVTLTAALERNYAQGTTYP